MKKIFTLALALLFAIPSMAQHRGSNWLTLAVKGGYGTTILASKQVSDEQYLTYDYFSPSYCYGARLGAIFNDYIGINVEYLGSGFQEKYEYNDTKNSTTGKLKFTSSDLLALFRYAGDYGFYVEVGPKFTFLKEATREFGAISETDKTDNFKDKFTSIALGLGFMPYNGDRVQVSLGIRGAYCPKTMLAENKGDDIFVNPVISNLELKPITAQVMLEVNYFFATFGSANCGRKKIVFFP